MTDWTSRLNGDPLPWLLGKEDPAVRQSTLRLLLDRPDDDPEAAAARSSATETGPIAAILAAQNPDGSWGDSGSLYADKYRATVWQVTFLDQMGADGKHPSVHRACEFVLTRAQSTSGGFGAWYGSRANTPPPPSSAIHCLHGNLLRALIRFGWLPDDRVQRAIDWQARAITGEDPVSYYKSGTSGPGFRCSANEKLPCAWGAVKAMLALLAIPDDQRSGRVGSAIRQGAEFLLSYDPAIAGYPRPSFASKPNGSWFKLGFPSGYVTDVLQNLEALCLAGFGRDARLKAAIEFVASKQDERGRWKNEYAYNGKTWVDIEAQGQPSKWVTLRSCWLLKTVSG